MNATTSAADMYSSLSTSLQVLLSSGGPGGGANSSSLANEDRSNNSESHAQPDNVYHQYLNSSSPNTTTNTTHGNRTVQQQQKQWWRVQLERWLQDAMQIVGIGSNSNIIHFWRSSRTSSDDSDMSLVNCRYMVWFVQYVLLHHLMMMNNDEHNNEENDDPMDYGKYMVELVELYHNCGLQLLNKNSLPDVATTTTITNNDQQETCNTAGVMWQMILQNVNLTPEKLLEYYYTYYEQRFGCSNGTTPPKDLDILQLLFAWPSFLQYATTAHATATTTTKKQTHSSSSSSSQMNKRRRISSNESVQEDWWSLFGYFIGHVILSSSPTTSSSSTMNTVQYLKEYTCTKLPIIMSNIGSNNNNNYKTNSNMKNLLLCGIAASVIDEVGEYTILDGLLLDDIDSNNNMNNNVEEDINSQSSRPSVGDIVDLLLMDAG